MNELTLFPGQKQIALTRMHNLSEKLVRVDAGEANWCQKMQDFVTRVRILNFSILIQKSLEDTKQESNK